jgi:hypothetical protein
MGGRGSSNPGGKKRRGRKTGRKKKYGEPGSPYGTERPKPKPATKQEGQ